MNEQNYTFDTYVVGEANKEIVETAKRFLKRDEQYQMVVNFGDSGNGKTHLAKIIKNEAEKNGWKVQMKNMDDFTSELICWLHIHRTYEEFCKAYDDADFLIIDDIHYLSGKESTAQCLAEIMKRLLKRGKFIWIISNQRIAFEQYFETVFVRQMEIKAPDIPLREKFWKYCETRHDFPVSEEVEQKVLSSDLNIGECEGIFKRLMAYQKLLDEEITVALLEEIVNKDKYEEKEYE